jgi:hypothetical protein
LWYLGEYQRARQRLHDTFTRSRRILGEDHPATLTSASFLGLVLWSLGDYQEARQLLSGTLARGRRILGEDHPTTLSSATVLGTVLWSLGDYQRARQLQNDTLTRCRQIRTHNHDQVYLLTHPLGKTKTQGVLASRVQLVLRVVQSSGFAFSLDISPRSSGSASGTHRDS